MKLFIVAICMLVLITGTCILGTLKSISTIDGILAELDGMQYNDKIPENAKEKSEKLLAAWEKGFFIISIFHPHQHLNEVKKDLVTLDSYSDTNEYAEWRQAHASLKEALMHLKELLKANLDNII